MTMLRLQRSWKWYRFSVCLANPSKIVFSLKPPQFCSGGELTVYLSEVLQFVADGVAAADMGEALRLAAGRGSASVVRELVAVGAPRLSCG